MLDYVDSYFNSCSKRDWVEYGNRFKKNGFSFISPRVNVRLSGSLLILRGQSGPVVGYGVNGRERGDIKSLSVSSSARMARYLRECVSEYRVLITLTYPFGYGYDGERAKRDLATFFKRVRRKIKSKQDSLSMFWFMEFQKSGRIHFHIFSTHRVDADWVSGSWYEIVGSGDDKHYRAGTRCESLKAGRDGACSYARKYARKSVQKIVPDSIKWVGRFWGVFGVKNTVAAALRIKPDFIKNKSFSKRLLKLSSLVLGGVARKKAKEITISGGDVRVYAISDKKLLSEVKREVFIMDLIAVSLAPERFWCPELDEPEINDSIFANAELNELMEGVKRRAESLLLQA